MAHLKLIRDKTYLTMYLSAERLSFLQASCRTSIRYVPGLTLTVARRRSVEMTTTCDDILAVARAKASRQRGCVENDDV